MNAITTFLLATVLIVASCTANTETAQAGEYEDSLSNPYTAPSWTLPRPGQSDSQRKSYQEEAEADRRLRQYGSGQPHEGTGWEPPARGRTDTYIQQDTKGNTTLCTRSGNTVFCQ